MVASLILLNRLVACSRAVPNIQLTQNLGSFTEGGTLRTLFGMSPDPADIL